MDERLSASQRPPKIWQKKLDCASVLLYVIGVKAIQFTKHAMGGGYYLIRIWERNEGQRNAIFREDISRLKIGC
jgi:hypothetical protein